MPQPSRLPYSRTLRYTQRNLGLIVVAYILYGALLFGASVIIAKPGYALFEWPEHTRPELLTDGAPGPETPWPTRTPRFDTAAH